MRKILKKGVITPDGSELIVRHAGHFVSHRDKITDEFYFIDDIGCGLLRSSINKVSAKPLTIFSNGLFEFDRENMVWGKNYDINMKRLPETEYILIKDLSTSHIYAILQNVSSIDEYYYKVLMEEIIFREEQWYNNN
jgi:hypothetical protein